MADAYLSSDSEQEPSPPKAPSKHKSKSRGRSTAVSSESLQHRPSSAAEKDAQRRHRALEKQYDRARLATSASVFATGQQLSPQGHLALTSDAVPGLGEDRDASTSQALAGPSRGLTKRTSLSLPDVSSVGLAEPHPTSSRRAEATFTPTAAGLRGPEGQLLTPQVDLQAALSNALSSILAAGLHQSVLQQPTPVQHCTSHPSAPGRSKSPSRLAHISSEDSEQEEELPEELEFSEDEGLAPDTPAFSGLFRPSLFKSLLHKARQITNMGAPPAEPSAASAPHEALFSSSKPGRDFIPCPQLFSDVLQSPWSQPGSLMGPTSLDKKLYCGAPELDSLLALPVVDPPIASLSSSSLLSSDALDVLKSEDRKTELSFRKEHQSLAWTIKTATATSFFNRATLLWLRQLQERLPPEDTRLHQDINKIVAATEYSADASLNSVKFASRALASSVTSRRLFWLRNWRADAKAKWKLAAAPFKAPHLFGPALDPVLVEDKDKRKVMPTSSYRRPERRYAPYSQRQPF
ncbi:lamina-associated polypeptide 2, isoforms alpha/zeta-like [Pantherophis guttatus]|uniref:Lamina-associated polypeptide 2, isoforms alpha/zeta-like n=1 Tax=Pantherophis guttatus TaxID=94885 RepID=A0A6P9DYM2_PANGU|nr:lamina-associated polypeptide 2, isoforms alpha/zeta-like [Pantherophis guttatus]